MNSELRPKQERDLLRCPMMQNLRYAERFVEAPRRVIDQALLWNAELRMRQLSDVDFFDGQEQLVWAEGWSTPATFDSRQELPGPVLGVLIWSAREDGTWWTELGYVKPEARKQGLYRMLWESCVYKAREQGVKRIQGGTSYTNTAMQACMRKLGRVEHSIIYDFEVPHE